MFKLKSPCANCPFRKGWGERFQFSREKFREIITAPAFQCHKTVDYGAFDDPIKRQGEHPQQCAGLMRALADEGGNAIMRVAVIYKKLNLAELDPRGEAYTSTAEAWAAHKGGRNGGAAARRGQSDVGKRKGRQSGKARQADASASGGGTP